VAAAQAKRASAIIMHTTITRKRFGRVALAVATALPLLLVSSGSVSAEPSGTSEATITIEGGSLSITVPSETVDLGTFTNVVGGGSVTGTLGAVTVSDARSAAAGSGWVASAISTAFTPPAGPALAASLVAYAVGDVTSVGTATHESHDREDLTAVGAVVTATAITGDNSLTWHPAITVDVPGGMASGVYTATITHSVT
jgi:hypothetical protein